MIHAPRTRRLSPLALLVTVVLCTTACLFSSSNDAQVKKDRLCTPGNYVFCRCQDRTEGSKLCNDDGVSFGPCEPCGDLGELPPEEEPFVPEPDAGTPDPLPECGNGIVERDEDCDDQNAVDGDGCDGNCRLAGTNPASSRGCPGMIVHVWGSRAVSYIGTTEGAPVATSVAPNCGTGGYPSSGASGAERIFAVTAHQTGMMRVATSDTTYNNFLYVSETCATSMSPGVPYLACINANPDTGGETLLFPVTAGETYHVFVDGAGITDTQGPFSITFSYQ